MSSSTNKSHSTDWIIFGVTLIITVFLLAVNPTWFWVFLPFVLTYFVKAIDYM